jgi:hypothetical protein
MTTQTDYDRQPQSRHKPTGSPPVNTGLRKALRAYYAANRYAEATKAELATKFGATETAVEQALWALKAEGLVVRVIVYRNAEGEDDC